MFNSLSGLFNKGPQLEASDNGSAEILRADQHIVVPQTAYDAWPENPAPLVQAVVSYVNHMSRQGRYTRDELCPAASLAFHCDFYQAQVGDGGHSQLVNNSGALLEFVLSDILLGLKEMGALDYLILARRMAQWVLDNHDETQSEYDGDMAEPLHTLDQPFLNLIKQKPLTGYIADWIAKNSALRVVADADLAHELAALVSANPKLDARNGILAVNRLQMMVAQNPNVHFATAVGALSQPEILVAVGNGTHMEIEGKERMTFVLRTSEGLRWCSVCDEGTAIYEHIEHDNSHMPENPFDATPEDIAKWKAPSVGERLCFVPAQQVENVVEAAESLCAAAAVHLLIEQLPQSHRVDFVTIMNLGADHEGLPEMTMALSLDGMSQIMTAIVSATDAALVDDATGDRLVIVEADDVYAHAEMLSVSNLK